MLSRPWKWVAITLALLAAAAVALVSLPNWNALRDPLVRFVNDRTGRELHIGGDLEVRLGWPRTRIRAADVTFSNPPWAHDKNMIAVRGVSADLSMLPLFRRKVVFQEVRLDRAEVALEKSKDGRKNCCSTAISATTVRASRSSIWRPVTAASAFSIPPPGRGSSPGCRRRRSG